MSRHALQTPLLPQIPERPQRHTHERGKLVALPQVAIHLTSGCVIDKITQPGRLLAILQKPDDGVEQTRQQPAPGNQRHACLSAAAILFLRGAGSMRRGKLLHQPNPHQRCRGNHQQADRQQLPGQVQHHTQQRSQHQRAKTPKRRTRHGPCRQSSKQQSAAHPPHQQRNRWRHGATRNRIEPWQQSQRKEKRRNGSGVAGTVGRNCLGRHNGQSIKCALCLRQTGNSDRPNVRCAGWPQPAIARQ